jgi:chemosensory pili system protein ChpA (sensor histidine kinase/response regulator)
MNILVVDDEEAVRALLKRLLSLHSYSVDTAADGAEAVDKLQRRNYDLLIIDRAMPRMSGIDAVAILRTCPRFEKLKILMLTHDSITRDIDEAFEKGVDGYIVKPFDFNKLLAKIERTLKT